MILNLAVPPLPHDELRRMRPETAMKLQWVIGPKRCILHRRGSKESIDKTAAGRKVWPAIKSEIANIMDSMGLASFKM